MPSSASPRVIHRAHPADAQHSDNVITSAERLPRLQMVVSEERPAC